MLRYYQRMQENQSRQVATRGDSDFILSIDEALERYSRAGHPRTPRSIQRYCAKGDLECRFVETVFGKKYLIAPDSLDRHIAYIDEVTPATGRDLSGSVATGRDQNADLDMPSPPQSTSTDTSRPVATGLDMSRHVAAPAPADDRYVGALERENEFLRDQVRTKDSQIKDLTERNRETNVLVAGLYRLLTPLLGGKRDDRDGLHNGGSEEMPPRDISTTAPQA